MQGALPCEPERVTDFLVTIKIRAAVTDAEELLKAWQKRDPRTADRLSDEPELALTLAVQDAVAPPDLSTVTGLTLKRGDKVFASVKAEPWAEGSDPW